MSKHAEDVTAFVEKEAAFQEKMKSDASRTASALIESYLGPDHKVINMPNFHSALSQALKDAREQGHVDSRDEALTLL